jgi:hypothetical protein
MSDGGAKPMATTHELKVWSEFWLALESGKKNFELR